MTEWIRRVNTIFFLRNSTSFLSENIHFVNITRDENVVIVWKIQPADRDQACSLLSLARLSLPSTAECVCSAELVTVLLQHYNSSNLTNPQPRLEVGGHCEGTYTVIKREVKCFKSLTAAVIVKCPPDVTVGWTLHMTAMKSVVQFVGERRTTHSWESENLFNALLVWVSPSTAEYWCN